MTAALPQYAKVLLAACAGAAIGAIAVSVFVLAQLARLQATTLERLAHIQHMLKRPAPSHVRVQVTETPASPPIKVHDLRLIQGEGEQEHENGPRDLTPA